MMNIILYITVIFSYTTIGSVWLNSVLDPRLRDPMYNGPKSMKTWSLLTGILMPILPLFNLLEEFNLLAIIALHLACLFIISKPLTQLFLLFWPYKSEPESGILIEFKIMEELTSKYEVQVSRKIGSFFSFSIIIANIAFGLFVWL